jgi:hypothetical protein
MRLVMAAVLVLAFTGCDRRSASVPRPRWADWSSRRWRSSPSASAIQMGRSTGGPGWRLHRPALGPFGGLQGVVPRAGRQSTLTVVPGALTYWNVPE